MKTSRVVQLIEEQIGREMTEEEVFEITQINDEGWSDSVVSPIMRVVLTLIEDARENGYTRS